MKISFQFRGVCVLGAACLFLYVMGTALHNLEHSDTFAGQKTGSYSYTRGHVGQGGSSAGSSTANDAQTYNEDTSDTPPPIASEPAVGGNCGSDYNAALNYYGGLYNGPMTPNLGAFVAINKNGRLSAWGYNSYGGDGAPTDSGYTQTFSTSMALAAMKADGSIRAWGDARYGGSGAPTDAGYTQVASTYHAFAALKKDGSIRAWGDRRHGGRGAPRGSGYTQIASTYTAFAALNKNGRISVWGEAGRGGSGAPTSDGYVKLFSHWSGFAGLRADGRIHAWGQFPTGRPADKGYTRIFSTKGSFAAQKADGSIFSWGSIGENTGPTGKGYKWITSNEGAFAALTNRGYIRAWGEAMYGGTGAPRDGGYTKIFASGAAFAGLKSDGSIRAWGDPNTGGSNALTDKGYVKIFSNYLAFAALKADGSIHTWGNSRYGGVGAPKGTGYVHIFSTVYAFAALKKDGTIHTWGDNTYGAIGGPKGSGYVAINGGQADSAERGCQFAFSDSLQRSAPTVHHYEVHYPDSGVTCEAVPVTIKACMDARCSKLYTGGDIQFTLAGQSPSRTPIRNGTARVSLNYEKGRHSLTLTKTSVAAEGALQCRRGGNLDRACRISVNEVGFSLEIPTLTSCKPYGEATLRATTQGSSANQCARSLAGVKKVNFRYTFEGRSNRNLVISGTDVRSRGTPVNLSFDRRGEAKFQVMYPAAGKINLVAEYNDFTGGDTFVVKPVALTLIADQTNAECRAPYANCSAYQPAGRDFPLKAHAACWTGENDRDFTDNPIADGFILKDIGLTHALVAPRSRNIGTVKPTRFNYSKAHSQTQFNAQVSEVGVYEFTPVPPLYYGEKLNVVKSKPVGRFTPSYFSIRRNGGEMDNFCNGFSYAGQKVSYLRNRAPYIEVIPYNAATPPVVTKNYQGDFAKNRTVSAFSARHVMSQRVGRGSVTFNEVTGANKVVPGSQPYYTRYQIDNNATFTLAHQQSNLVAPFDMDIYYRFTKISDSDNISAVSRVGAISSTNTYVLKPAGQPQIRFGRVAIDNAHGSELNDLSVTVATKYFDGRNWSVNILDNCTKFSASNFSYQSNSGGAPSSSRVRVGRGVTQASLSQMAPLNNGEGRIIFSAPGAGHQGSINLSSNMSNLPWLRNDTDGDGVYDNELARRVVFGVFQSNSPIIFKREIFPE